MSTTTTNKPLHSYTLALLDHHGLLASGKEDDLALDAIELRLSEIWASLDEPQRQQARGMSSDLYWIRRSYGLPPKGKKREEITPDDLNEFDRLNESQDYLSLLQALRVCAAAVPPVFAAMVRATSYANLGFWELSEPFLKATIDLAAKASLLSRTAFDMLVHVSPAGAFEKASQIIESPEKYAPISVGQAITFVIDFLGGAPTAFTRDDLAEMLQQADKRLDDEPTPQEERIRFLTTVGAQLVSYGMTTKGIEFLKRAQTLDPENAELLSWMGEAIYPQDREHAVELLIRSIQSGSRLIRPYLHLANHFLAAKEFDLAKTYAAHAAERSGDNFSLSVALEIMAICLSEQAAPTNLVLELFRRAVQLAPTNKRAVANLASFEKSLETKTRLQTWETESQKLEYEPRDRRRAGFEGPQFRNETFPPPVRTIPHLMRA